MHLDIKHPFLRPAIWAAGGTSVAAWSRDNQDGNCRPYDTNGISQKGQSCLHDSLLFHIKSWNRHPLSCSPPVFVFFLFKCQGGNALIIGGGGRNFSELSLDLKSMWKRAKRWSEYEWKQVARRGITVDNACLQWCTDMRVVSVLFKSQWDNKCSPIKIKNCYCHSLTVNQFKWLIHQSWNRAVFIEGSKYYSGLFIC